jgi:hypothetical protein
MKGQNIVVTQDYINYKVVATPEGLKKIGIVFRVQAELISKSKEVNLNGLFSIGLAAQSGAISGSLKVQVHGLSGEPVSSLLPLPSDISEASLQAAMQSVALLKAKVWDSRVSVIPQEIPN